MTIIQLKAPFNFIAANLPPNEGEFGFILKRLVQLSTQYFTSDLPLRDEPPYVLLQENHLDYQQPQNGRYVQLIPLSKRF